MDVNSPPISPIGVQSQNREVSDQSPPSFINYAIATTAPGLNQPPVRRPYPPVKRVGVVDPHDRPFFEYGHKDKETIAKENNFDLIGKITAYRRKTKSVRMNVQSFSITCWTDITKEKMLDDILKEFGQEIVRYVCVASEVSGAQVKQHLHVQIILTKAVNKTSWFLDKYTGVHCNYQVTKNNCAWNDYIKKDGDYIEYGQFCNTGPRPSQQWPQTPSPPPPPPATTNPSVGVASPQLPPAKRATVRGQADERRLKKNDIAATALKIAEKHVVKAMDYVRKELPYEFMQRSDNCYKSFNYVHKQAKHREQQTVEQEFVWDLSFPNCTSRLHIAVSQWIKDNFRNPNRPKCLVLIGPTGTGKTSFALSLPGPVCYFKGRWSLNTWSDAARYLVFDDIPWDDFEKRNFPSKKDLLSANGQVAVTDKYQPTVTINVTMPSLVLLNPGDEGSLTAPPTNVKEQNEADYWKHRAVVYQMDSEEYFYKSNAPSASSTSSGTTRELLGHSNEFEDAQRRWLAAQERRRRQRASLGEASPTSSVVVATATTVEHQSDSESF